MPEFGVSSFRFRVSKAESETRMEDFFEAGKGAEQKRTSNSDESRAGIQRLTLKAGGKPLMETDGHEFAAEPSHLRLSIADLGHRWTQMGTVADETREENRGWTTFIC